MGKTVDLRSFKEPEQEPLPENIKALELLQMVYRGETKATSHQMRAAIEALPYENPRLSAVAVGRLTDEDFATRLDRAVEATAQS